MRKIHLQMDGNQIRATWDNYFGSNIVSSPVGLGDDLLSAVTDLIACTTAHEINSIVSSIENEGMNGA